MTLDYLINNIKSKENWLDLCNHLDKLADMPNLSHGLRDMRKGKIMLMMHWVCALYIELSTEFQVLNGSYDESSTVDYIGKCYRKNSRRNTFKNAAKSTV